MSQGKEETRRLMWEILDNGHEALENLMKKLSLDTNSVVENSRIKEINCENDETPIVDPPSVKTKGASNSNRKQKGASNSNRKQVPK